MKVRIDITEEDVRKLIIAHLREKMGDVLLKPGDVSIETKSKQNYRSEWEVATFRVTYEGNV